MGGGGDSDRSSSDEEAIILNDCDTTNPDFEHRKMRLVYNQVQRCYQQLQLRSKGLELEHSIHKILSYTPGAWNEKRLECEIPEITTLLLVGPKGSGKSTLVNRISKVFDSCKFAPERAQVSYMAQNGGGTHFLHEYTIPRNSASFCLYDTRSLTDCISANDSLLTRWMKNGVRHGDVILWNNDDSNLRIRLGHSDRQPRRNSCNSRKVNFVIFVVNGVSVLKVMDNEGTRIDQEYIKIVSAAFCNPHLSFRDDKPVVVFTHGDLLSLEERVRVRMYLGKLLGIPPATQVFDIPETVDETTDLAVTDMLRYSLEHADKYLPPKGSTLPNHEKVKVPMFGTLSCHLFATDSFKLTNWMHAIIFMCVLLLISMAMAFIRNGPHRWINYPPPEPDFHINWHKIKHLW